MKSFVKSFVNSLSSIPEGNLPPEYYRSPRLMRSIVFGNFGYPSGLVIHLLFLIFFAVMGVTLLALFNIFSVILWAIAIYLHRKGLIWSAYILSMIEIIAHAALCVDVIGWNAGFQYYVLVQPVVVFLLPGTTRKKAFLSAIYCFTFALMNYYATVAAPKIELNSIYLSLLNYGNIISVCALLAYLAYQYSRAAITTEEKLEREHQKANAALKERNQAYQKLNLELAEAADYVRTILPQPIVEGSIRTDWRFIPSTSLGGDAFGYHLVDKDHFSIYLIDVSGHGVGAALLSVSVMNVLRTQSLPDTNFKDPGQVLGALNDAFPGEENNDMFFTIWYGIYNKSTRELTYASGGHPPALLLTGNSEVEQMATPLRTPNYVIGGNSGIAYRKQKCFIDKQNKLYIFSDGVYEIEKSDGSMWRLQEFSDFMAKTDVTEPSRLDKLYHHAMSLGDTETFQDDFTIVEIEFT